MISPSVFSTAFERIRVSLSPIFASLFAISLSLSLSLSLGNQNPSLLYLFLEVIQGGRPQVIRDVSREICTCQSYLEMARAQPRSADPRGRARRGNDEETARKFSAFFSRSLPSRSRCSRESGETISRARGQQQPYGPRKSELFLRALTF